MRIVTNEQKLKRNKLLAQVLFFVSLGVLFLGLILNAVIAFSPLFWIVPCLILPLGLLSTVFSVRLTNEYIRVPHPETALSEGLQGINKRSILYNYLAPCNHVLVTPNGVYALHVLFHSRAFTVQGDKWIDSRAVGPLAPLFQFLKQENIGKPFKEAEMQAERVQLLVDSAMRPDKPGDKIEVMPVVVMIGPKASLSLSDEQYPVVFADRRKRPHLKGLLRDEKRRQDAYNLTDAQIEAFHQAMVATVGSTKLTDTYAEFAPDAEPA
jgi:hypothetical protein